MDSHEKGRVLEDAVASIEGAILKSFPDCAEKTYRVECRKLVTVRDVTHEIDVWVEIDLGKGYASRFIFECKNWSTPVGKNEVIILAEKVRAVSAQRGYLVAPSITADAAAQIATDDRLEFVEAAEVPLQALDEFLGGFHTVGIEQELAEIHCKVHAPDLDKEELPLAEVQATLGGEALNFKDYFYRWLIELSQGAVNRFPSGRAPIGIHPIETQDTRSYQRGEMTLNGQDVAELHLSVKIRLHVTRPRVVSGFDVHTRGRACTLEPIPVPGGGTLHMTFIGVSH